MSRSLEERIARLEVQHAESTKLNALLHQDIMRRLHEGNYYREQITNERAMFLPLDWYNREHGVLADRVRALEIDTVKPIELQHVKPQEIDRVIARVTNLEMGASKASGGLWMLGIVLSAVIGIATLVSKLWIH